MVASAAITIPDLFFFMLVNINKGFKFFIAFLLKKIEAYKLRL